MLCVTLRDHIVPEEDFLEEAIEDAGETQLFGSFHLLLSLLQIFIVLYRQIYSLT